MQNTSDILRGEYPSPKSGLKVVYENTCKRLLGLFPGSATVQMYPKINLALLIPLVIFAAALCFFLLRQGSVQHPYTQFAPCYDERRFNSIKTGDTQAHMIALLGLPIDMQPCENGSDEKVAYYSVVDNFYDWYAYLNPVPVTLRRFIIKNGKIQQKIKTLGTTWDGNTFGCRPIKRTIEISDRYRICYDESQRYPYRIETRSSNGAGNRFSLLYYLKDLDRQTCISYTRKMKDSFLLKVYRFTEPVSFHNFIGWDMITCILENSAALQEIQYMRITPHKKTCNIIDLSCLDIVATKQIHLHEQPSIQSKRSARIPKDTPLIVQEHSYYEDGITIQNDPGDNKARFVFLHGSWLKCITPEGKTGWCFDGFLQYRTLSSEELQT